MGKARQPLAAQVHSAGGYEPKLRGSYRSFTGFMCSDWKQLRNKGKKTKQYSGGKNGVCCLQKKEGESEESAQEVSKLVGSAAGDAAAPEVIGGGCNQQKEC
jgi:hypothetical protein